MNKSFLNFLPALACTFLSLILALLPFDDSLRYERLAIQSGEWWRLLSGHLLHLSWMHLVLNVAALLIIWEMFFRRISPWFSTLSLILLALVISAALFAFNPELQWYVGLSGVLHGLFALGALTDIRKNQAWSILLLAGLAMKLGWEQWVGSITASMLDGHSIVIDAHLYGAIAGIVLGLGGIGFRKGDVRCEM